MSDNKEKSFFTVRTSVMSVKGAGMQLEIPTILAGTLFSYIGLTIIYVMLEAGAGLYFCDLFLTVLGCLGGSLFFYGLILLIGSIKEGKLLTTFLGKIKKYYNKNNDRL